MKKITSKTHIAILLTCFNRKEQTLDCLSTVFNQRLLEDICLSVYLVDDGSSDGTSDAVLEVFPSVTLIQGDGQLFWTGGMELAFSTASKTGYDYYLWLNDDTLLYSDAVAMLLNTSRWLRKKGKEGIIVGSTQDKKTGLMTYGGVKKGTWVHPCKFRWLTPKEVPLQCDTMNGNCVLIPSQVAEKVEGLDLTFRHYAADFDYGLRAVRAGFDIWIAPGFIGTCASNSPKEQFEKLPKSETVNQFQRLSQPKGLPTQDAILHPFHEWKAFTQRHAGPLWPIYWILPYRRIIWLGITQRLRPF
ncbi:MAG: glycosyltransferase family 2 protein [Spirulina sp.]